MEVEDRRGMRIAQLFIHSVDSSIIVGNQNPLKAQLVGIGIGGDSQLFLGKDVHSQVGCV
jgi:hypothetical protein